MYTVTTVRVNIRKAREKFSEIVTLAASGAERVVIVSRNRPKAAIVSLNDLASLEESSVALAKKHASLQRMREIRNRLKRKGLKTDLLTSLRVVREERIEEISRGR